MRRHYERSSIGTQLIEKVPCAGWLTTTFLGALCAAGFITPLIVDGVINGQLFPDWLQERLSPALRPGDIAAMDKLTSHKVGRAKPS